jgi:hypothetical protein
MGVHAEAHLLDDVGIIGPRDGQILESTGEASVSRCVGD